MEFARENGRIKVPVSSGEMTALLRNWRAIRYG